MQPQDAHAAYICQSDKNVPEAEHNHRKYIVAAFQVQMFECGDLRICDLKREMQQVVNNKDSDEKACPDHILGGKCRAEALVHGIPLRFCGIVLDAQNGPEKDMKGKNGEQAQTD